MVFTPLKFLILVRFAVSRGSSNWGIGYHAWGTPTGDSDLDFFVVVRESNERPVQTAINSWLRPNIEGSAATSRTSPRHFESGRIRSIA